MIIAPSGSIIGIGGGGYFENSSDRRAASILATVFSGRSTWIADGGEQLAQGLDLAAACGRALYLVSGLVREGRFIEIIR